MSADSDIVTMYRHMLLARLFDARAVALFEAGDLDAYPACHGLEATHVGAAYAMAPDDCMAPSYRECGAAFVRGMPMADVLRYWGGYGQDASGSARSADLPWCIPLATQALHAAGAALAFRLRGERRAAVTFVGDGATSEGAFYEALNVAGVKVLPVVFVIVNNGWAIATPVSRQTAARTLAEKGSAAGIPGEQVDGTDVLAVRDAVARALHRARSGKGPTVLEALVSSRGLVDPLPRTRDQLTLRGKWDEARQRALEEDCAREVQAAFETFKATALPGTDTMFDHLFHRLPPRIEWQRQQARSQ